MRTVIIIALLLLTACSGEFTQEDLIAANKNIDSYHMDIDITMSMSISIGGETTDVTLTSQSEGDVDVANRELAMVTHTVAERELGTEAQTEMYIVDGYLYMSLLGSWAKLELTDDVWESQENVDAVVTFLETGTIERLADEDLDGTSYAVIMVEIDPEALLGVVAGRAGLDTTDPALADSVKAYSVKLWINKDTLVIERMLVDSEISIDDAGLQSTMKMVMDTRLSDIGKEVVITLPPGAEDAIDITPEYDSKDYLTGNIVAEYT